MPEGRLQRTRESTPVVPPCIRLGHEWQWFGALRVYRCIRCRLQMFPCQPTITDVHYPPPEKK